MGRSNCEAVLKKRLGRQHLCALISRYKIENRLDIPRIVVTNGRQSKSGRTVGIRCPLKTLNTIAFLLFKTSHHTSCACF